MKRTHRPTLVASSLVFAFALAGGCGGGDGDEPEPTSPPSQGGRPSTSPTPSTSPPSAPSTSPTPSPTTSPTPVPPTSVPAGGGGYGTSAYKGPFCEEKNGARQIIGLPYDTAIKGVPTLQEARRYSLTAVNALRAMTGLQPLVADDCLDKIGATASDDLAMGGSVHAYFIANCMNAAHKFGRACECDWAQENMGAASGSRETWQHGIQIPLCGMMDEPEGVGHRSNIQSSEWKRMGVGVRTTSSGATWVHEFGR